jgi:hypothetical protein
MLPFPDSPETDPMPLSAPRKSPFLTSVLVAALAASIFAAGCSGGTDAPSHPAAPAGAASTTPGAAKSTAPATKPTDGSAKADTKPKAAEAAAVAAKEAAAAPAVKGAAPEIKLPASATFPGSNVPNVGNKPPSGTLAGAATGSKPNPSELQAAQEKADLAKKASDPASQDADPNSKAKLTYEFGSDTKNFGKCMQGDVLTHTFLMQSSGEEDLVIKQAKPTCGCTVAQVATQAADGSMAPYNYGSPIQVGRKIEITATLHTQNKRGHSASRINIFSNDPRGQTQLGLEADVDPYFQVNPANLNFNQVSARDTANEKVTISTTKGVKVKLTAALENIPQGMKLEVAAVEPDADGKSANWEVVCHLGPGLVEGNLAYTVGLKSDVTIPGGEKLPNGADPTYEVSLPISAHVNGMISYTPAFVSLGLIRPGQVVSRTVRVTSHDTAFKLTEPKILVQGRDGPEWDLASHFSTVIRPVAGENSIDIELRLDGMPDSLNGSFSGQLVIQVGHPEKPEIKLPITGVCRGGAAGAAPTGAPASPVAPSPSNRPK